MSQFDFANLTSPLPGSVLVDDTLEPWRDALNSLHSGPTRPYYAVPGMMWINNAGNPWIVNVFDGAQDIIVGTINTTTNTFIPNGLGACLLAANNLSDLANASTARTNLGLGALATKNQVAAADLDPSLTFIPPGAVLPFAMPNSPGGWYVMDASLKNRVVDAPLFTAIGTRFGEGDGLTTFGLPPQPEFIRGWDPAGNADISQIVGNISAGQPTISVSNNRGQIILIGMTVSGTGITAGTTITAYNSTSGVITLSANATATTAGVIFNLGGRLFGSIEADDFRSHSHTQNGAIAGSSNGTGTLTWGNPFGGGLGPYTNVTNTSGGPETRPRNTAFLYCIKR